MNARTKTHTAQRKLSGKSYQTLVSRQKTLERITPLLAISEPPPLLYTSSHISFLRKALQGLPPFVTPVDSTKPWFLFWTLRSLEALNSLSTLTPDISSKVVKYFEALKCPATGAYGGSSAYMPHAATTYAGVCALLTLGTDEAYRSIDRARLYGFFMGLKNADGSFRVHEGGESDVRGAYTVLATATLLGILTEELGRGVAEWIKDCQTYEGGFGGEPGDEAHGGYSYCALASLALLGKTDIIDLESLAVCEYTNKKKFTL